MQPLWLYVSQYCLVDRGPPQSPSAAVWPPSLYSHHEASGWRNSEACKSLGKQYSTGSKVSFIRKNVSNLMANNGVLRAIFTIVKDISGLVSLFSRLVVFMPSWSFVCYCRTHVAVCGHGATGSLVPPPWNHHIDLAQMSKRQKCYTQQKSRDIFSEPSSCSDATEKGTLSLKN